LTLVRGDIRALPFAADHFGIVLAAYGVLQSLTRERDLLATLQSVARVLRPGGLFGVDLVADVPNWREYRNRVSLRGRAGGGARLTLVESVRQDRARRLTTFEQRYIERRGRQAKDHRFTLTFRTIPVRGMVRRLERAGFAIEALLGDYEGRPWDVRADVWIILAKKV
jgi:SAM-dependent methyltransferase